MALIFQAISNAPQLWYSRPIQFLSLNIYIQTEPKAIYLVGDAAPVNPNYHHNLKQKGTSQDQSCHYRLGTAHC
jgi:hypothetical protein